MKSKKSMPGALAQGKGIYPIIPYRCVLGCAAVGAANNEREILDFDLLFENNEVMDIWKIDYQHSVALEDQDYGAADIYSRFDIRTGVFEDPEKPVATDLSTEAVIEDDSSLVDIAQTVINVEGEVQGTPANFAMFAPRLSEKLVTNFPQPYTVARNLAVILQWEGTEGGAHQVGSIVTVWGRRRKAHDSEFKNIIYRQRF
jgi:hypothetical protein